MTRMTGMAGGAAVQASVAGVHEQDLAKNSPPPARRMIAVFVSDGLKCMLFAARIKMPEFHSNFRISGFRRYHFLNILKTIHNFLN